MNLWVNRLRQLAPLAVALFFFSCEDDTSFLGYKNPNKKFQHYSIEIPVDSKVYLIDPLRSSNFALLNDQNRLLVGNYTDPVFGSITSSAVTQFVPVSVTKIPTDAVFDSASLILAYDTYTYGSEAEQNQTFKVYEVSDVLDGSKRREYVTTTPFNTSNEIGSKTVKVWPQLTRENYKAVAEQKPEGSKYSARDSVLIKLDPEFGALLFQSAMDWAVDGDSTYYYVDRFVKKHKGLAIKPDPSNTMLVGFNTANFTQMIVYFHTAEKTKQRIVFSVSYNGLLSYNQILADRSGSELSDLTAPYTEVTPANGNRYIQAGTGVMTEINFDKFLYFADTVQGSIVINQAELVIDNIDDSNKDVPVPTAFSLRYVKEDNRYRLFTEATTTGSQDQKDLTLYKGFFRRDFQNATEQSNIVYAAVDDDHVGYAAGDQGSPYLLTYSAEDKAYSGNPTMFLQQLYRNRNNLPFKDFILFPAVGSNGSSGFKTTNRLIFPAENIKLRIKYTKPTVAQ